MQGLQATISSSCFPAVGPKTGADMTKDRAMTVSNVIDFTAAQQSRRERLSHYAVYAGQRPSRLLRYRDGIDGLVTAHVIGASAQILPFAAAVTRPSA